MENNKCLPYIIEERSIPVLQLIIDFNVVCLLYLYKLDRIVYPLQLLSSLNLYLSHSLLPSRPPSLSLSPSLTAHMPHLLLHPTALITCT